MRIIFIMGPDDTASSLPGQRENSPPLPNDQSTASLLSARRSTGDRPTPRSPTRRSPDRPRVYATCDLGPAALGRVTEAGLPLEVHPGFGPPPKSEILRAVRSGVAGLLTTLRDPIDAEVLEAGRSTLRVVSQCAVGLDNIDLERATALRIPVFHTPDVLTAATAEFALFALGALARRLAESEELVRTGAWRGWHPFLPFLGTEIRGMRIGVVGTGRIGRAFAARCVGLDVDLLLYDRGGPDRGFAAALNAEMKLRAAHGLAPRRHTARYVEWETLLAESDAISLHVPLIGPPGAPESTYHLIDDTALRRMKRTALLVNTSRGPVVDEVALARALREERIGGAALDVFATEPLPLDSPLQDPALRPRLRLSHHFASGTRTTRLSPDPDVGMAGRSVAGLLAVLAPEPGVDLRSIPYLANPEVVRDP